MKKGLIDLHVHTKYSGENIITNAPTILQKCLANGVETIAITDHNTTAGCREALEFLHKNQDQYGELNFIAGIEITCDTASVSSYQEKGNITRACMSGGIHLLGYGIDPYNPRFKEMEYYYSSDLGKQVLGVYKFINRYYKLNIPKKQIENILKMEDTNAENVLVRVLTLGDNNVFKSYEEFIKFWQTNVKNKNTEYTAFKKRVNDCLNCKPDELDGYAKQDIYEMLDLIESSGGVAVLAHPTMYRPKMELAMSDFALLKEFVDKLTTPVNLWTGKPMRGIVGLEMLHGRSFDEQFKYKFFDSLIQEKELYVTGGSDSHLTKEGNNNFFGVIRQNYSIVGLDFVNDFELIRATTKRAKNGKSIEEQSTLKNDFQTIKAGEIIKGRTISEKLVKFEREVAGQIYYLKEKCKNGNVELNYEKIQRLEYWTWIYSIYFNSVMENKAVLFDDKDFFYSWLEQRKQFFDDMKNELQIIGNYKNITIKEPNNPELINKINFVHPFEKSKKTLGKVSNIIAGENVQKILNDYPQYLTEMVK